MGTERDTPYTNEEVREVGARAAENLLGLAREAAKEKGQLGGGALWKYVVRYWVGPFDYPRAIGLKPRIYADGLTMKQKAILHDLVEGAYKAGLAMNDRASRTEPREAIKPLKPLRKVAVERLSSSEYREQLELGRHNQILRAIDELRSGR